MLYFLNSNLYDDNHGEEKMGVRMSKINYNLCNKSLIVFGQVSSLPKIQRASARNRCPMVLNIRVFVISLHRSSQTTFKSHAFIDVRIHRHARCFEIYSCLLMLKTHPGMALSVWW